MASTLPEEVIEEIFLRVPPFEPGHLAGATLVCKAWHNILSDHRFLRRYHKFHGTPPLLGYISDHYYKDLTIRVDPLISVAMASPVHTPTFHCSSSGGKHSVLDCRHGRVLVQALDVPGRVDGFIVWDPITGSQHHIRPPTRYHSPYMGAVLCAKEGCDHLDCHGGPFFIVLLKTSIDGRPGRTWAVVYSTQTQAWSAPTPHKIVNPVLNRQRPNLHIGDAPYFNTRYEIWGILKYDLRKHELSVMDLPIPSKLPILFEQGGGGLGVALMLLPKCVQTWSWQVNIKGIGRWVNCNFIKLNDTVLPKGHVLPEYICTAEGTSTVFIRIDTGIFTLDLNTGQVTKIGERHNLYAPSRLYMNFYTRKY